MQRMHREISAAEANADRCCDGHSLCEFHQTMKDKDMMAAGEFRGRPLRLSKSRGLSMHEMMARLSARA